jgi:type IV pilus assembly protein PilB
MTDDMDDLLGELRAPGATALHVEPGPHAWRVRVRVDGALRDATRPQVPAGCAPLLVEAVKRLANLDLGETRLPQQGFALRARERLDVRTLPTPHGEALSLRRLDPTAGPTDLDGLGLDAHDRASLDAALHAGRGLVLVAGPFGSGRRTLVRACLRRVAAGGERSAMWIDALPAPALPGVVHVLPSLEQGLRAVRAARVALDFGADAIAVRDAITDVDAAETLLTMGEERLALATLVSHDAVGAVVRLIHMGAEPALMASALRLVVATRLLARLCDACGTDVAPPSLSELRRLAPRLPSDGWRAAHARGCGACDGTGRRGHALVVEALAIDDQAAALVRAERLEELRARRRRTLRESALTLAREGVVSIEEALRGTPAD